MSQTLVTLRTHLVFSTKRRERFIEPAVEPELHAYLAALFKVCDSPAILIDGTDDHIHALFSLSKKWALADVVEKVKKDSSKWIKSKGPQFRNFHWQNGYAGFSIGKSGEPQLMNYIRTQKKHHAKQDFKAELRAFLEKYGVAYNERYLWD